MVEKLTQTSQKLWAFGFIRLLILILFVYNGVAIVNSTFSVYIVEEFKGTSLDVSLASSAMIISSMLFRPFAGFLIDRVGRRTTLAVSLSVTALISLAYLLPKKNPGLDVFTWIDGAALRNEHRWCGDITYGSNSR